MSFPFVASGDLPATSRKYKLSAFSEAREKSNATTIDTDVDTISFRDQNGRWYVLQPVSNELTRMLYCMGFGFVIGGLIVWLLS